ncbi:hypothetical protein, partial [Acetobacter indonesiensis]|uniref:hypothetical protein n=1 Tax=Acetobacter indonesiensis TaxID=104101 RepID=UPI001CA5872E
CGLIILNEPADTSTRGPGTSAPFSVNATWYFSAYSYWLLLKFYRNKSGLIKANMMLIKNMVQFLPVKSVIF